MKAATANLNHQFKFQRFYGHSINTAAMTLRLVEPWLYKRRHVVGDSAVMLRHRALFTGMVKTAAALC